MAIDKRALRVPLAGASVAVSGELKVSSSSDHVEDEMCADPVGIEVEGVHFLRGANRAPERGV